MSKSEKLQAFNDVPSEGYSAERIPLVFVPRVSLNQCCWAVVEALEAVRSGQAANPAVFQDLADELDAVTEAVEIPEVATELFTSALMESGRRVSCSSWDEAQDLIQWFSERYRIFNMDYGSTEFAALLRFASTLGRVWRVGLCQ